MSSKQPRVCELCGARYDTNRATCPLDGAQLNNAPDPLAGLVLAGRYVIDQQIGAGGMGIVYRARNLTDDSPVAIKFLDHSLARSKQNRERFLREARAANKIDHEHIINIMNSGETDDGLIYLVMEFLDGVPLNVEIRKGPMSVARALDVTLQIAKALARAHELDVVHRDIKPENVFLLAGVGGDFVKVLDFGLAQMKGEMKLTLTGAIFGTPEYMAPEQCLGERATHAVDLYALGAVLFEMLTGSIPFSGNIAQMLEQHVRAPAPSMRSRRPDVPREVDEFVSKLLAKAPGDRHRDAHHVVDEIKRLLGRAEDRERTATRTPTTTHTTSKTADGDGAWSKRAEEFGEWLSMAHPSGEAPSELREWLETLTAKSSELTEVRRELHLTNAKLADLERDGRELRLRIGQALDELGHDDSRIARESEESRSRLDAARERLEAADAPLRAAWLAIPAPGQSLPAPSSVERLRDLGNLAAIWLEAQRAVADLARDADARAREQDDVRYQIAQLKQRLETANGESESEAVSLRARAHDLDARRRAVLDELTQYGENIYRHFMGVPGFRERVQGRRVAVSR